MILFHMNMKVQRQRRCCVHLYIWMIWPSFDFWLMTFLTWHLPAASLSVLHLLFCVCASFISISNFLSKGEKRWSSLAFKPNENEICFMKSSTKSLSLTLETYLLDVPLMEGVKKSRRKRKKKMCLVLRVQSHLPHQHCHTLTFLTSN